MKKVLILGSEGYIGTALYKHLKKNGYDVKGIDNKSRELNVVSIGSKSIVEKEVHEFEDIDISKDADALYEVLREFQPDAIVHLAEQPSAPFSMMDRHHASETQRNNIVGTMNVIWGIKECCPDAELIKLGTEGVYPDWIWDGKHIPEGNRISVLYPDETLVKEHWKEWEIPIPRYFGSYYHASKLYDSLNIDYANRIWGLKATDVSQGVVFGHLQGTRLDIDEYFGTVVNRFVAQAVSGIPLTVYGEGGQTRGMIALQNSIDSIRLFIDNPAKKRELRTIHQTTKEYSVMDIAKKIQALTGCEIQHIENPRFEMPKNHFTFDNSILMNLGLKPIDMDDVLPDLIEVVKANKDNINLDVIMPKTKWK